MWATNLVGGVRMIDTTINLTIDQEENFEQILECIENIPGVVKSEPVEGSYFEYNTDTDPFWEVLYDFVSPEELEERLDYWKNNEYHGSDYLLCERGDGFYIAVDNSSSEFFMETFKTEEEAIAWMNREETE